MMVDRRRNMTTTDAGSSSNCHRKSQAMLKMQLKTNSHPIFSL
jgi:hypothetical protein